MATIPYATNTNFGAKVAAAIGNLREALADVDRTATAALAAAYAKGGQGPDFSALDGDFGVTTPASNGQSWYEALDAIRIAFGPPVNGVTNGAAKDALNKLDKGA